MYTISQFSKLSGFTVKALRYYDQEDLLHPSYRNNENQYRYYSEEDLVVAQRIKLLRSFDFSIMEIKEAMEQMETEEDLHLILKEKIELIEHHISKEKELIHRIQEISKETSLKKSVHPYVIDIVEKESVLVGAIKFTGAYQELEHYVPMLYKIVKKECMGKHFNCYFDNEYVEKAEIELCIPIKRELHHPSITCKTLPKIKAVRILHTGSYDTLYLAYKALFEYINEHGMEVLLPIRETYMKGPGMIFKGNPEHYVTEILLPFEIDRKG